MIEYLKENEIVTFCELTSEEILKSNKFYSQLIKKIVNTDKYSSRLSFLQKNYHIFKKYSVENSYDSFPKYLKKLSEYINYESGKYIEELNAFEKLSFNKSCIPDESLFILQMLSIKGGDIKISLNRSICHICKKAYNLPKIIISNCFHCYCYLCMEEFCNKITEGSMKAVNYVKNQKNANCIVENCDNFILLSDAEKCGKLFGADKDLKRKSFDSLPVRMSIKKKVTQDFEIIRSDIYTCEICKEEHLSKDLNSLDLTCCLKKVCKIKLIERLKEDLKKAAIKKNIKCVSCPLCLNQIDQYLFEHLLEENC